MIIFWPPGTYSLSAADIEMSPFFVEVLPLISIRPRSTATSIFLYAVTVSTPGPLSPIATPPVPTWMSMLPSWAFTDFTIPTMPSPVWMDTSPFLDSTLPARPVPVSPTMTLPSLVVIVTSFSAVTSSPIRMLPVPVCRLTFPSVDLTVFPMAMLPSSVVIFTSSLTFTSLSK